MTDAALAIFKGFAAWHLAYAVGCEKQEALEAIERAMNKRRSQVPTPDNAYDLINEAKDELMERLRT